MNRPNCGKTECYSETKRNMILMYVKTGPNFIYIMVKETSQTLKMTYHIITLIQTSRKGKTIPREIRQVFTWD